MAPSLRPQSSQQPSVSDPQQPGAGSRALVPVYVLPENLHAVQEFVLSLGQPILSPPPIGQDPVVQSEGFVPHLGSDGADDLDQHDSTDETTDDLEFSSALSQLSISRQSVPSTPSASRHHSPTFSSGLLSQASPITPAGYISSHLSFSPHKSSKKYYAVVIGKKAGVFWDEWYVSSFQPS